MCYTSPYALHLNAHLSPLLQCVTTQVNGLPSMQLSHELGARPDPSIPYTATKFGLLSDTLQILFNVSSPVAAELSRELSYLRVGVKPGPLCDPQRHIMCIDTKDVQKLVKSTHEFHNRGNFVRIYPSQDGEKYSGQVLHLHNLVTRKFSAGGVRPPRTLWSLHHLLVAMERMYHLPVS